MREKAMENIDKVKYWVCCPLCDNDHCMRGTDKCEAEQWKKMKLKEAREWRNHMAGRKWG
jgi:hypothetical protein